MKLHVMGIITVIALLLAAGCTADKQETSTEVEIQTLTVMTHDSFDVSADLVAQFEREHQAKIEFLQSGDAGQVLNTAVLQKANPLADVLYGVDNSFLGRALAEGIFQPYVSGETAAIREEIREYYRDERVTPIDYGDVCLNYDKAVVSSESLPSLESLGDPAHKDQLVVMNPATSSPGLSFLLLTVGYFGEDGYLAYWQSLKDNGVKITSGWEDAYWGEFSAASEGERPIVVSYATSPAAEVYFSEGALTEPPTAVPAIPGGCFRQIEYAGVLTGTDQAELAGEFIDFMLSQEYQEDIPLKMWVYPVRADAELPEVFVHAPQTVALTTLRPEEIAAGRDAWIDAWTDLMMR